MAFGGLRCADPPYKNLPDGPMSDAGKFLHVSGPRPGLTPSSPRGGPDVAHARVAKPHETPDRAGPWLRRRRVPSRLLSSQPPDPAGGVRATPRLRGHRFNDRALLGRFAP